jgi:hypothetical protein
VGTYTIESGTGRFEGTSGGGVLTVDGSPGDFFIITLDGNLSF